MELVHMFGLVKALLLAGLILFLCGFISLLFIISELGIKAILLGIFIMLLGGVAYLFSQYRKSD